MALTRRMLKALGIEDEKAEEIISAHIESTDALKAQRDEYKAQLEAKPAPKTLRDALRERYEQKG